MPTAVSRAHATIRAAVVSTLAAILVLTTMAGMAYAQGTYVRIDAPGAGTNLSQGTFPSAIVGGWIAGSFIGPQYKAHGFLRSPNGSYKRIDVPQATQTYISGINIRGEVVGSFQDSQNVFHGFVRTHDGVYTQLDAPGATSSNAYAISGNGQVTGVGKDHIGSHGFVWDPVKGFKVFNVPGSAAGSTYPSVINGSGVIAGSYYDRRPILLGFVRLRSGKIEAIEGNDSSARMVPTAINASGQVTGYEFDQGSTSGFVRDADGTITLFGTESHGGPTPTAINNDGTIVGYFFSDGSPNQAFVRDSAGNITFPQLPHTDLGNIAVGIDAQGKIIGYYNDASEVNHGWLFIP